MRFGSVCSGIEAASVAFAPLGWEAAWFAEIEPYPSAVLKHHYPRVPNLGDMTKLARMIRVGLIEAPDVLCGGTPCQAFSVAGLRGSLGDARGNLTLTFCELANAIDDTRDSPAIHLWENVPGVLNTPDNAFGCFLAGLAGEADALQPPGGKWDNAGAVIGPRRTVAWRTFDAQFFSLAQRRRRVFVVASARPGFDPLSVLFEFDGMRRDTPPSRETGEEAAGTLAGGARKRGDIGVDFQNCASTGDLCGTLLGEAQAKGGQAGLSVLAFGGNNTSGAIEVAPALLAAPGSGYKCDFETETLIAFDTTQITSATNRSQPTPGDPCHPLAAGAHPPAIAFNARQQCVSSTELFGSLGSSSPQAEAVAIAHLDVMPTMTSGPSTEAGNNARSGHCKDAYVVPMGRSQVRRLTPWECERLQGFPVGYTAIAWRGKPASECPDGPRYRALGNSWAVPNVAWIGRRIAKQL